MGLAALWGDYEVHFDQVLGRGGMGTVYRALQKSLGRWVAVKVLEPSKAPDPTLRDGFLGKFRTEIAALARLNDSRIVTIFQAGEDDGRLWFAMELIEGRTVEDRLSKEGAFPEPEARRIAAEVARALDAAARQGIVHRDIKPANIFLLADGSVKLGDFGLARVAELGPTRMTEANAVACTPAYASPEQAEGRATDLRSDLYSLGCSLYEMVTERPPFPGSSLGTLAKQLLKTPTLPRVLNPNVSEDLQSIVLRCIEKEPDDRYQNYPELIVALEPRASAATAEPRGWLWPAAAAAGLALLGVILTAIFTSSPEVPAPQSFAPREVVKTVEVRVPVELPVSVPAPPPPDVPLPFVRERGEGEVEPSPTREEADLRPWFLAHVATPEELQIVRRAWAIVERRDAAIQAGDCDDALAELRHLTADSKQTPYASLIVEAEILRLQVALEVRSAFAARLQTGSKVDLRLTGGRTVSGTVEQSTAETIELKLAGVPSEVLRIKRKDIAEESIDAPEPLERRLLFRATHGNPHGAASLLIRKLDSAASRILPAEELARLPGIVHAAALRAVATLDGTDHLPAIAVLQDLEGLEKLLPENLRYVLEARAMLVYELHAAEALSRKDYEEVLQNFDRSRAAPRAASAVLAAFQREAAVEFVAEGHREGWKYEPFESDPDVRRRHLYEDIKNKAFVLDQSDGVRVMRRAVPQASRGYVFEYAFVPAVGKPAGVPQWVLILTDASKPVHLQLVGTPDGMAVFETFPDGKSGKEVARHAFREVGGWRKIAIVPLGKMALVYDHSRLAFKVAPPEGGGLETHLEIGLTGGALKLRSLKTPEHE